MAASCAASGYIPGGQGYIACLTSSIDGAAAQRARAGAAGWARGVGEIGERLANPPQPSVQPMIRQQIDCRPNPFTGGFTCE